MAAAYATIIGQFVSFLICVAYLRKSKSFHLSLASFRPDFPQLKRVAALGTSSFLTQLSIVVITIINNILLVSYGAQSVYGADIPLAAFVVIMKLFQIVLNIAIGIAAGAQPIVGYNYGAGNYDRVKALLKLILKWTACLHPLHGAVRSYPPGLHPHVWRRWGAVHAVCRPVPADLPGSDPLHLPAEGVRHFPAVHRPRQNGRSDLRCSVTFSSLSFP